MSTTSSAPIPTHPTLGVQVASGAPSQSSPVDASGPGAGETPAGRARRPRSQLPGKPSTDRFLGKALLAFFLCLYLITGSGHGYSPDGEFAFNLARSLTLDPNHDYLKTMRASFYHWGFVVSALSQPLVLIGQPLANAMPQKDSVEVDGHDFQLGYYRVRGYPDNGPTVGGLAPSSYVRQDLSGRPASSLAIISFLSDSQQIPQGATVADVTLADASGHTLTFPIRAGVETAEWSLGRKDAEALHAQARVASVWSGNPFGRNYYAEFPMDPGFQPSKLEVQYLLPEGALFLRSVALLGPQSGDFQLLPSDQRMWSERENADLFAHLFYSPYNAIITALSCVLVFALARLLGYGQAVSVAATLLYGLATLAWPYSKYDFSEPTVVLFLLASLYLILRWDPFSEGNRLHAPAASQVPRNGLRWVLALRPRESLLLLAGLFALLMVGTKYAAGPLAAFLLLQVALIGWRKAPSAAGLLSAARPAVLFCIPFVAIAVPALAYMSRQFGYWPFVLDAWNGIQRGWLPLPFGIGLRGLIFSPGRSFFLYSPPAILALVAAVPFLRRHRLRSFAFLAVTLFYFSPAYAMKVAWHAGAGWGPRYQVVVLPLLMLMAAPLIERAIEGRRNWARYALLATFVLGVALQLLAVSKSFDLYLGMFRYEVVGQLPDQGARYGGADYYPYSAGLDDGSTLTATVWAWPFSPILAQGWLLSADLLSLGPASLEPIRDRVLASPPWRLWGINVVPAHPDYGLGVDFWWVRLKTDFPASPPLLGVAALVLLSLEAGLVFFGARLVGFLFGRSGRHKRAVPMWIAASSAALLLLDLAQLVG